MLRLLPFTNFLSSCTYREEEILVASKQMLIPDVFETVLKGFTYNSAVLVKIWNNESSQMELSSKGGKKSGGD